MSGFEPAIPLMHDSVIPSPADSFWRDVWKRLSHRLTTMICLSIVALYLLVGLLSFLPAFERKAQAVVGESYQPPSLSKFDLALGCDIQGRPVIWRLLFGTRIALLITVFASILSLSLGISLGVLAGYFGGWIDDIITWLFTTVSSVPWILLMIALVYSMKGRMIPWPTTEGGRLHLGEVELDTLVTIIIALGLTEWVGICRLIRAEVIRHRDRDYVIAARAAGVGTRRILTRHILPNVSHLAIISFSLGAVSYVQAEVVLTFLGLGISDRPSWGRMIDDAKMELLKGVWWQAVAATVAIGILCLALNILGDAFRDALDPRLRGAD
jgi:peptide/nickel transport system permease protein